MSRATTDRRRCKWQPDELATLRRLYPDFTAEVVAALLHRPVSGVYGKAQALGLSKSEAFNASDKSGRVQRGQQHPAMVATQFRKGLTPWNKGQTGWKAGGRSEQTQFRPGSKPHNTLPVGSYRLDPDGYLQRKIGEARGSNSKRWRGVHELVWTEAHGQVPAGHIVVFRPGRRTAVLEQITLDAVELISRAENARRNHPRSRSPELGRLVQLKGAITRQVNRITKEHAEKATA